MGQRCSLAANESSSREDGMREFQVILLAIGMGLLPQERKVEPTWLYRDVSALPEQQIDLSSESCHYTAIFGEGDAESKVPKSVARFG